MAFTAKAVALALIFAFIKISARAEENWDVVLAKRVVFAVDTSASMVLNDVHIKMRQAISVWTKYLSPQNTSISISQFKLKEGLSVQNVAGAGLRSILPEEDFFGGTCLFCGLKEAAKVLEDASAQDLVVLLMEERAEDAPHDTPEFALQSVQPRFRIFTVALTANADPDLETLSSSTHGSSDFVPNPSFARLLLTFDTLPVAKSYSIITMQECDEETSNCPVEFELDESVTSSHSSLNVFLCPYSNGESSVKLDYDLMNVDLDEGDYVETLYPEFDLDTGCWVLQKDAPQSGIWQLKVNSVNDSFSVAVVLQNPQYHKLRCFTQSANNDIFLKATIKPAFTNLERLDISAFVEVDGEVLDGVSMEMENPGSFSICLKPTGKVGRHAVSCKASKSGVPLLTSQTHSIKIAEWPENMAYCQSTTTLSQSTTEKEITEPAIIIKDKHLWTPEEDAENSSKNETENTRSESTEDVEIVTESPFATNGTLKTDEQSPHVSPDGAQMIIVVVGGILIAEICFILYRCKRKAKSRELQRSLIPYTVDPKVGSDLKYHQVSHKDVDEVL